jgi:signal transduction histidine kinase/ligand-binding sensor domain-containing protein
MPGARFRLVTALAAGALPASPLLALDPHRASSQYVVTRWGADDLPSNTVHALLQTRDGYLWLGTSAGLARFDGARLVLFNGRNTPGFGDGGVTSLGEAHDGSLYAGTTAGLVLRFKDGAATRLSVPSAGGAIHALVAARDGGLWMAMYGRPLHRWALGRATSFGSQLSAIGPLALAEDEKGGLWVGTRRDGLSHVEGRQVTQHLALRDSFQALHFDRQGTLWAGTPHGLARLRGGQVERLYTRRDGLSHDNVTALLEDRDGNLWVGTGGGGLNRWREGRFDRLTTHEGLSDDDVRGLVEDAEGNLWAGTADGLNRISDGRFVSYGRLEGLRDPSVRSVARGSGGSVWIGTTSDGVSLLRDGRITHVPLPAGVGPEAVLVLYESRDGSLWIGLDNGGLFRVKDGAVTEHTPLDARPSTKVPVIFEDEQGMVFWATGLGLARLRGRTLVPFATDLGLGYPHGAHRDSEGRLWLYGSRGLARIDEEGRKVFSPREGLPHERVRFVSDDSGGGLWAATIGGLAFVKDDVVRSVNASQGLPETYLRLVLDDGLGHLWIASMGHLFRLDKREVEDLFAGRADRVFPVAFDSADGLRTSETLLSNSPGFRDPAGRLWFATAKGVSVVDPARVSVDEAAPPVLVESLNVDGGPGRLGGEFPPGRGEVRIEYTALRFAAANKLRFRYRLEGYDDGWVEAGDRRTASYNNLGPGDYRFVVMASNRDGKWNAPPTSFTFVLRPPFFRTTWFYLACAAALVALAGAAYRLHVGQMRSRFAAIIAERTRIARELHDTLAQGLAGVGIQIDTALRAFGQEPTRAREHIKLARAMVRSSLAEVRRSIWVLRAQTSKGDEGLAATLSESLAQLTADTGIEASLHVTGKPRALTAEVERNLLRIAHEAVTNAVRHAKARTIATDLRFEPQAISLLVRDDGQGFDPETCLSRRPAAHFGLVGISERARALGGELRLQSRPGAGTEIVCRLPYDERNGDAPAPGEAQEGEIL